jgi:hypothetical protein
MRRQDSVFITAAVEGNVDEAVVRRLIEHVGGTPGPVYGRNGKNHLRQRVSNYNQAARLSPWIILVDLDHDAECAPPLRGEWLPNPSPYMCFRVAVRQVESWLLADRERLARFLSVNTSRVPQNPESVDFPKNTVIELARQSRRREIREDMVPRPGSGRAVGPAYTARLIEFVIGMSTGWRPEVAAQYSESLNRSLRCLHRIKAGTAWPSV